MLLASNLGGNFGSRLGGAVDGLLEDGAGDVDLPLTGPEVEQGLGDGLHRLVGRGSPQHPAQGVRRQQVLDRGWLRAWANSPRRARA